MKRAFSDLGEGEVLALAIALEEEDGRIYGQFAQRLAESHPATAGTFQRMQQEEASHQARLTALYHERFGEHLPLIRRQDVRGFIQRHPIWLKALLPIERIRHEAESMELESRRFYEKSAARSKDAAVRELLLTLAAEEATHENLAAKLERDLSDSSLRHEEDAAARRQFVLQVVQPGLVGLMDGSVSTLAPVFAAAFATKDSWDTFLVGLAASIGAGISMGFAEALSDDGALSGRGRPYIRGLIFAALYSRPDLRLDDGARRNRPHLAISRRRFSHRDGHRDRRRPDRAARDRVDSPPLHGYPAFARHAAGRARRRARLYRGRADRQRLSHLDRHSRLTFGGHCRLYSAFGLPAVAGDRFDIQ